LRERDNSSDRSELRSPPDSSSATRCKAGH
jgi:hypothetical protein